MGYVRLTWEACLDVHVKTSVVQIYQVQRQVDFADVFDGGLFVIKLGRTKMLQAWRSSCNSRGARKMTSNLVPTVNIFLKMSTQTSEERYHFFTWLKMSIPNPCAFWRWRGGSGKKGFNMVELGRSFWAWRSRFHQVVFPLTKLATICSWRARHSVLLWLPGRIKAFWPWNTLLLTTFQVEVWKKFWKVSTPKSAHISCLLKNFVNKQHREVNFRRGRCLAFPQLDEAGASAQTSCGKTSAVGS